MRPINGGRFDLTDSYNDNWLFEPKINGWRAVVCPDAGLFFNRHGKRLTIEADIKPLLAHLPKLGQWLDCEILERRGTGKKTLIVLDLPDAPEQYAERVGKLSALKTFSLTETNESGVYRLPQLTLSAAHEFWKRNDVTSISGVLFEGLVAKRKDSRYIKSSRPESESTKWVKHRFANS